MNQETDDDEEICEEDKPWQGMIDFIQNQIDTFFKHGMDKEHPELFNQMSENIEVFKNKQLLALKPHSIKTTETPSHKVTAAEAYGNDCPNNSCS